MAYTKQTWQDLPNKTTPINASRLGHMEDGIYDAAQTADSASSTAASAVAGLDDKVDKVTGKGLSTNDFTDTLKTKLDNIESGAQVNVQADWDEDDTTADSYIANKPTLGTAASKNSTTTITSDSTDLPTGGAVYEALAVKTDNSVIAPVENGTNASQAYAVGEHFIKDGQFKEVTNPIASGEAINSGNTVDKPIAELLDVVDVTSEFTFSTDCSWITTYSWTKIYRHGNIIRGYLRFTTPTTASSDKLIIGIPSKYRPSEMLFLGTLNEVWSGVGKGCMTYNTVQQGIILNGNSWEPNTSVVATFEYFI